MVEGFYAVAVQCGQLFLHGWQDLAPELRGAGQLLLAYEVEGVGYLGVCHVGSVLVEDVHELISLFAIHESEIALVELEAIVIIVFVIASLMYKPNRCLKHLNTHGCISFLKPHECQCSFADVHFYIIN